MDYRVVLRNDEIELEKYNHYKALGYNDNQSFVLAVFTYGASRSVNSWMDTERNGIALAMKHYDLTYANTDIKFCDYLTHLLNKVLENYGKKPHKESISCYLNLVLCKYFGGNIQKADTAVSTFIKGFKGAFTQKMSDETSTAYASMPVVSSSEAEAWVAQGIEMDTAIPRDKSMKVSFSKTLPSGMGGVKGLNGAPKGVLGAASAGISRAGGMSVSMPVSMPVINPYSTAEYETIEEKGFVTALAAPTSTFRMTCNTASMGVVKNNMKRGLPILKDMIRIEEMLNYFKYSLSKPTDRMFNINTELCDKPNSQNKMLFIGVQGKKYVPAKQNIVFLLDVSGSMIGNVEATQLAFFTVISKMKPGDVLSLVTYSSEDEVIYDSKVLTEKGVEIDEIIERFLKINIAGCTYGSQGIETAYSIASKNFITDGVNRVILVTDGDLNFGLTSKDQLETFIKEKKKTGVFLSVLGTGLGNYKDSKLEVLAKNGNGNYFVVNDIEDVQESVYNKYASLVFMIAKDVKAQVEFNPRFVKKYRLIGYENRQLNHDDFANDAVISEPFGSGASVVALYELELVDGDEKVDSGLKYQKPVFTNNEDLCTVSVRFKEPDGDESQELHVSVKNKIGDMTKNLKLAYSIYTVAEKYRNSEYCPDMEFLTKEFNGSSEFFKDMVKLNGKKMSLLYNMVKKLDTFEETGNISILQDGGNARVVNKPDEVIDPAKL